MSNPDPTAGPAASPTVDPVTRARILVKDSELRKLAVEQEEYEKSAVAKIVHARENVAKWVEDGKERESRLGKRREWYAERRAKIEADLAELRADLRESAEAAGLKAE